MFDSLSDRFDGIFKRLRGKGRLTDGDVDEVLREIRVALLEADVNLSVVRTVVGRIREQCVGAELVEEPHPGQQVIKIVNDELVDRARRRDAQDHLRLEAADRRADGRPAGLGQDDRVGQAGPLVQGAGPQPAPRRRRPPAPGRGRAAAHARPSDRRAGVLASRATRSLSSGGGSRRSPPSRAATSSSSTPPAASRSTPR